MKRLALYLAIVAVLAACPKSSEASDFTRILRIAFGTDHHPSRHAAQRAHVEHHVDLQARAIERQFVHQAAHHQPLTPGQHGRLHNELGRSAYHDALEHHVAHTTRAYAPRAYAPGAYEPIAYPPQYTQSYRGVPNGYGVQNGASQYRPSRNENRLGCAPYGRY